MKKRVFMIVLCAMLALSMGLFAGCGNGSPDAGTDGGSAPSVSGSGGDASAASDDGEQLFIALSHFGDPNPWNTAQITDFDERAQERGYKYAMTNCQGDVNQQNADIADLVLQQPDALVLGPATVEGLRPGLEAARNAGVPVFIINRECDAEYGVDYVTRIGCDPYTIGYAQGEVMVDAFGADADVRIVELSGTPGASNTIGFATGFRDALTELGADGYDIIVSQPTNFNPAEAQGAMENIVQSLGLDGFDAVFGHLDGDGIAAINVIEDNGGKVGFDPSQGEIVINCNGRTQAGIDLIKAGKMICTVDWEAQIADSVYDVIEGYLAGEEYPEFIEIPTHKITTENVAEWDGRGW